MDFINLQCRCARTRSGLIEKFACWRWFERESVGKKGQHNWIWCTYEKHMLVLVLLIEVTHLLRECCSFCSQKTVFHISHALFQFGSFCVHNFTLKMDSLDFVLYWAWIFSKESVVYIFSQWTAVTKSFHEYFPCLVKYINFLVFFLFSSFALYSSLNCFRNWSFFEVHRAI